MAEARCACLAAWLLAVAPGVWAQSLDPTPETTPSIEVDGTLGSGDQPTYDGTTWTIDDCLGDYNDSRSSLFHSFGRFNVPGSEQAVFTADHGSPTRVFARVTWELSRIDGILDYSAIPGATFYLVNPAGIHFGENGQVRSSQGSFVATTAGVVRFDEGSFEVDASTSPSIMTLENPVAFGFLGSAEPVTIARGNVRPVTAADGGFHTPSFAAVGGRVELGRIEVEGLESPAGTSPVFDSPGSRLALVAAAPGIDVPHELETFEPSSVDPGVTLGDVAVRDTNIFAAPPAGSLLVRAGSFTMTNNETSLFHRGNAASGFARAVDVAVQGELTIEETTVFTGSRDDGFSGDIRLEGSRIQLIDSAVTGETRGRGPGVNMEVHTTERLTVSGSRLASVARGEGGAGDVVLSGGVIEILNGAEVGSTTLGPGDAGAVTVTGESLTVRGGERGPSVVNSRSTGSAPSLGAGGPLSIDVARLELLDGGQVTSSTSGSDPAGNISITADDVVIAGVDPATGQNESGVFAQTVLQGDVPGGAGGSIAIESTGDVRLANRGRVAVETRNRADAGGIDIVAGGRVVLEGEGLVSALATTGSTGQSGSISIRAGGGVELSGGSSISARSNGDGNAGTIEIDAGPRLELVDSAITTEARSASGGQITITADELVSLTDSSIDTSVFQGGSTGDGGDVRIDPELVVLNRSQVLANAQDGNGGRIFIQAGTFIQSSGSLVQASSLGGGIDGTVIIESPTSDLTAQTTPPPQQYLDASALLKNACAAAGASQSSLVVSRVAGLPATPEGPLPSRLWDDAWLETRLATR